MAKGMDSKFDTGMNNAGFDDNYTRPPKPQADPKAGTHSIGAAGGSLEMGLNEQAGCSPDPSYNGMNTVGKDQKPQGTPRMGVSKNGNDFEIC